MGLRRDARKHDTLATQAAQTEQWWEHAPGDRVRTIDGPGRVEAVHDGPFPGSEEYEISLEGGLGGGRYTAGQIDALLPTQGSVEHTAADDYPELGNLLIERPDPARIRYTAALESDQGIGLVPAAPSTQGGEDGQVMRDMGEYHSDPAGDFSLASLNGGADGGSGGEGEGGGLPGVDSEGYSDHLFHRDERVAARAFDHYHPDQVYLRFGHWPENERSHNNVTGHPEDGVSVYDLDHNGDPMDPDPDLSRGHEHDESCEPDCDLDSWNDDYGNDTLEEMNGRVQRAEQARRRGASGSHPDVGHLVKGDMIGIGHDGEPLLNNVRRVGDWIDHRHMFVPGAQPHHLARTPYDEDYEHPEEPPTQHTARQINGKEIDQHGSAPGWNRAANPNEYDRQSTEGEPDPQWLDDIDKRQHAMAKIANSEQVARDMEIAGPHGRGYAYQGDGGQYCHGCAEERDYADHDGPMSELSWHDLRVHGSPHGEHCDDCHRELTPERPHTLQECQLGEDCPSADEDHDHELKQQEYRDHVKKYPERFSGKDLSHLAEDPEDRPDPVMAPKRGPDEAPLHLPEGTGIDEHWGSEEDFKQVHKEHKDWADHLKRQDEASSNAEQQINDLFSGPEFAQHKEFLEGNTGKPIHLSSLAHKTVGPMPDDPQEIAQHLIEHHGYTHDQLHNLGQTGQGDELAAEHELEHNASTYDEGVGGGDFGRGEQGGGVEHKHGPDYRELNAPSGYHPAWGGAAAPDPYERLMSSVPAGVTEDDLPRHPSALSMLVTAAADPSFRFHVTAAWRDVQAKAKRIRSQGGVSIKHSDGMTVVADVQGDHNVYETALQRAPGRRQSVAVYACGCKWGAYHWGASDDLSRFAGRMCSHALALQYEAASRGMFGRDVEVDDARPRWVPSKVVVKYDIDSGQHIRATAAVPEQPPVVVAMAMADDDPVTSRVVTAAVNDMFGDTSGYTEPSLMNPMGPTQPWDTQESPASAGNLKAAEPSNWGSITGPSMLPRVSKAIQSEGFWQALIPIVRAVAPAVMKAAPKVVKKVAPTVIEHEVAKGLGKIPPPEEADPGGTRATLHDEPEGALPETDGEEHTASLGDVDIADDHDIFSLPDDALSPESPSMQTQGSAADVVAEFQRSAAAKTLMDSGPKGDTSNAEIARAAEEYLSKTAGVAFTRAEQDALINESPGVQASNTDRLDIAGTHYAELDRLDVGEEDDTTWLM